MAEGIADSGVVAVVPRVAIRAGFTALAVLSEVGIQAEFRSLGVIIAITPRTHRAVLGLVTGVRTTAVFQANLTGRAGIGAGSIAAIIVPSALARAIWNALAGLAQALFLPGTNIA